MSVCVCVCVCVQKSLEGDVFGCVPFCLCLKLHVSACFHLCVCVCVCGGERRGRDREMLALRQVEKGRDHGVEREGERSSVSEKRAVVEERP